MRWRSLVLPLAMLLTACPSPPDTDTEDPDTSDPDTSDPDTDTDTDTDPSTATDCHVLPSSLPDWAGSINPPSLATSTTPSNNAGIAAARTSAAGTTSCTDGTTACAVTVSHAITNAVVTAIGYSPNPADIDDFWLTDSTASIHVHLGQGSGVEVIPGDQVSFTATQVSHYNSELQITAISGFTKGSSAQPVYVRESNGASMTYDADGMVVHHLYGELENQACDSPPCECGGGRVCFDLVTRDGASENRTSFRINNNNLTIPLVAGDCVEMVAPLGRFNGTLQFDIDNFSWQRWFGNSEG